MKSVSLEYSPINGKTYSLFGKSDSTSGYWDRRLATTREQYHLYMVEIELTNRLNATEFINADKKIALMPYCLQDFTVHTRTNVGNEKLP